MALYPRLVESIPTECKWWNFASTLLYEICNNRQCGWKDISRGTGMPAGKARHWACVSEHSGAFRRLTFVGHALERWNLYWYSVAIWTNIGPENLFCGSWCTWVGSTRAGSITVIALSRWLFDYGKLSHATKVVIAGWTFLRRMIDTSSVQKLNHHIKLTPEFRSDLAWWECFLPLWNSWSFMSMHKRQTEPEVVFSSDASGSWGCGAIWATNWIQCEWQATWVGKSIALKELQPIVLACAIWGASWSHKRIQVLCDNAAVIEIISAKTSKCRNIMHLLRCLHSSWHTMTVHYRQCMYLGS